jgi:glycosyltransferase involved in cell wall biosynthesis
MAAGLVPVVADHPANRWWLEHGTNGLLVDPTPDSLAAALERAVSDVTLRAHAAEVNPGRVRERGDLRRNMEVFVSALRSLVLKGS